MPLLRDEAAKLSATQLERGVIEEIIERDDLLAMLPFKHINGKSYTYTRENTLAEGAFLSPNEDIPESASTFTEHTATLKILAGDVDVDKFLSSTMSDHNDQTAIQIAAKAKGLGRQFRRTIFTGDSATTPREFDGLSKLVASDQVLTAGANGGALTLGAMDELRDSVAAGADAILMRPGTYRAFKALLRAAGGTTPEHIVLPGLVGTTTPTYDGVPILISDYIPGNVTQGTSDNTCSIWAARFNEVDGLHGIIGGGHGGFQVEDIGTLERRDAYRYRLKWYVSMVLKSTRSLSQLKGITNV